MEHTTKFIDFEKYCKECKHESKKENEEPCDECLATPAREYSHKPIFFEKIEKKNKTKKKEK